MRFGLPKRYAFLLGLPKMDPTKSVLGVLPTCFVVNSYGLRQITMKIILQFHLSVGVRTVLSCGFTTFSPSCDEFRIQKGCQTERTSPMEYELLPTGRYENILILARMHHNLLQEF